MKATLAWTLIKSILAGVRWTSTWCGHALSSVMKPLQSSADQLEWSIENLSLHCRPSKSIRFCMTEQYKLTVSFEDIHYVLYSYCSEQLQNYYYNEITTECCLRILLIQFLNIFLLFFLSLESFKILSVTMNFIDFI